MRRVVLLIGPRLALVAVALGLSGAVLAGQGLERRSTFGRVLATHVDLDRLAALERAPTPLARRVIDATWGRPPVPLRIGRGTAAKRANALQRRE